MVAMGPRRLRRSSRLCRQGALPQREDMPRLRDTPASAPFALRPGMSVIATVTTRDQAADARR
jgi:hypothetical protein